MTPGLLLEVLIVVLLIATICYCAVLSSRLKKLKSDESALRSTIAELFTATELAERAIKGLKTAAMENEKSLGGQVRDAERLNADLRQYVQKGNDIVDKLVMITKAVENQPEPVQPPPPPRQQINHQPVHASPPALSARRSNPRAVSDLAAQASARISAIRGRGA